MGLSKGPTEGGSGGKRGHSKMDHWGFTDEVKTNARRRRRIDDKTEVVKQSREEPDSERPPDADS